MLKPNHLVRRSVALSALALATTSATAAVDCNSLIAEPVNYQVSFEADIQPIFDTECTPCHNSIGSGGLYLRFDVVHDNLLGPPPESGVPSVNHPGFLRVKPEHPEKSLVFLRMNCLNADNPPSEIGPMPPGEATSTAMQALVYDWIAGGAIMAGGDRIFVGTYETIR